MPYFTYLFLFLFSPPTAHFNGAMSRRAEYYTTCMNTCYYKSNFVPQLISKIEMAPKSFYIIQRTFTYILVDCQIGLDSITMPDLQIRQQSCEDKAIEAWNKDSN